MSRRQNSRPVLFSFLILLFFEVAAYGHAGHSIAAYALREIGPGLLHPFNQFHIDPTPAGFIAYADALALFVLPFCALSVLVFHLLAEDRITPRAAVALFLLAGTALRLYVAIQNPLWLQTWPLQDDSYYYFNIARNLASSGSLRHDSFNTTTGFQPLLLLLITPIFAIIHDKNLAINAVLVLQSVTGALFCYLLYKLCRLMTTDAMAVLVPVIWAFSPHLLSIDLNGMDTGISLLLVTAVVYVYRRDFFLDCPAPLSRYAILGLLLGLAFLARVDNAFLAVAIMVDLVLRRISIERRILMGKLLVAGVTLAVVAVSWLVIVIENEGSLLPGSGSAVRFLSLADDSSNFHGAPGPLSAVRDLRHLPMTYYLNNFKLALSMIVEIWNHTLPVWIGFPLILGGFAVSFRSQSRELRRWGFFALFGLFLLCAYCFYIFGQWFYGRYLAPFLIVYLAFSTIGASNLIRSGIPSGFPRLRRCAVLISLAAVVGFLAAVSSLHVVGMSQGKSRKTSMYDTALWINENTPPDAVIGAFQSGIVGYYLNRDFYGLDGKINRGALRAMREHRMDVYVREKQISYLLDWPALIDTLFVRRSLSPDPLASWKIVRDGTVRVYGRLDDAPGSSRGIRGIEAQR
jgi:Dolichyl-phosphate-mannose-protein mannosyltransferase